MYIDWCKCVLHSNCRLDLLNLNNEHFDNLTGVYVIWSEAIIKKIICVGSGLIRDKLINMKIDKEVLKYGVDIFVTWAAVPKESLEGAEAFLCKELNPDIYSTTTCSDLVIVNLP